MCLLKPQIAASKRGGCLLNIAHSSDIGGGGVTRAAHAIGSPPFSPKSVSKFSIIMSCINQQAHCMDARAVSTCHGGKGVQTMLQESVTPSSLEKRYGVDGIDSRCSMGFSIKRISDVTMFYKKISKLQVVAASVNTCTTIGANDGPKP